MIFWKNKYEEKVISNQELERKFLREVTFIPMLISYYTKNCEREEYRKSVLFDDNEAMRVLNEVLLIGIFLYLFFLERFLKPYFPSKAYTFRNFFRRKW